MLNLVYGYCIMFVVTIFPMYYKQLKVYSCGDRSKIRVDSTSIHSVGVARGCQRNKLSKTKQDKQHCKEKQLRTTRMVSVIQ